MHSYYCYIIIINLVRGLRFNEYSIAGFTTSYVHVFTIVNTQPKSMGSIEQHMVLPLVDPPNKGYCTLV